MLSAELVKIAAAKRKEKENHQQIYSSSSGVHAKDELQVLFAGGRLRQQRPFESVKPQQRKQQQKSPHKEDEEIISDYKRISRKTTSEFESKDEDIALKNTKATNEHVGKTPEIHHPKIQINNEESYEFDNGDKKLISDNGDIMDSEKSLLVALSISLESDLPAEFYERLFRELQVQNLMKNSDSFRTGVEILCTMDIIS